MKVAFWGDICLQHEDLIERSWQGPRDIHDTVKEFVQRIDFSIATLENPLLGDERTRNREKLALHASPKTIQLLKALKVKAVTVANNHIADYGGECGLATLRLLEEEGIMWFGAGYAGHEGNPVILERDGISLACLGYSHPPCDAFFSSPESFGSARYSKADLGRLIPDLKKRVDYVLAFMHWGMEDVNYPVPENVKTAHEIIDLGADVIIGSHPHVYQGYEIFKNKCIQYSLGNCIFGDIIAPARGNTIFTRKQTWRNRIGLVPVFSIDRNGMKLDEMQFVHFRKDNTIAMLTGLKARLNSVYLGRISSKLKSRLTSLDNYERWWRRNIKGFVFLIFLEHAITKRTVFRPGVRHLRFLKRMFRQGVDNLQTGQWKE
jgi:hypothetical protein